MAYAHGALGNKLQEKMYYNKVKGVLRAIEDSGDALTQKTPRHILMFDHALDVMASEGYTYGKSRIISRTVEFIPFTAPRMVGDKKRQSSITTSAAYTGTSPKDIPINVTAHGNSTT